jgi:hypothetical protein
MERFDRHWDRKEFALAAGVCLEREISMATEVFREPASRDKLADAKTLKLVPRLPFPNFPQSPSLKRTRRKRFDLLCKKFATLHKVAPDTLKLMLNVALSIEVPAPFIQATQVRKLEKKLLKLAKEIEEAEATGFLLAVAREQYERRLTTRRPLSPEAQEILEGPRAARVRAEAMAKHLKGEQKQGNQIVKILVKRASQYGAWLESVKDKNPARAKRLSQLKLLYIGFYLEFACDGKIPYRDVSRLLECVEGFPDKIDDSKYGKDMLAFMMDCKDSWSFMYTVFGDHARLSAEGLLPERITDKRIEGPITHPSQYRIRLPDPDQS